MVDTNAGNRLQPITIVPVAKRPAEHGDTCYSLGDNFLLTALFSFSLTLGTTTDGSEGVNNPMVAKSV